MDNATVAHPEPAIADLLLPGLIEEVLVLRLALDDAGDDLATYRALAQQALGEAHTLTVLVRRQNDTIIRLHDELRRYVHSQIPDDRPEAA